MLKLHNIFNEVIIEKLNPKLIVESVDINKVIDAINGKYNVNILYRDYDDPSIPPSKRYIQVYNFSKTKGNITGGNDAIRAFQIFGGTKTENSQWKIFRLDRIEGWYPTTVKFNKPVSDLDSTIPKYNNNGDNSMAQVYNKVDFNNNNNGKNTISRPNKA